ncbi:hypothetical protein V9K92_02875 [Phyllobacterium sp. CCNWLW109]|uniref:hypothetical protein n=1 Tax=Phyllobacterium sp. CCNWLW109 TaxID=3127479 RepID=UPI0030773C2D
MQKQPKGPATKRPLSRMKLWTIILVVVLIALGNPVSLAVGQTESRILKRQTARAIRNAGFWCDRMTDARIDKVKSLSGTTIVKVTCDDKINFAQYMLTMSPANKITKVEIWK